MLSSSQIDLYPDFVTIDDTVRTVTTDWFVTARNCSEVTMPIDTVNIYFDP
jgi:hypothetical protein